MCRCRALLVALVLLPLSGSPQPAIAATNESCGSVDRLATALRIAQVLFPELKGKELSVVFLHGNGPLVNNPTEGDDVRMRLDDKDLWHPPDETADQYNAAQDKEIESDGIDLPLDLYFSFIDIHGPLKPRHLTCHPLNFTSNAGHKKMEEAWSAINPHPEWSDEQELAEATKLGLRYGPKDKDAVLRLAPLKELSQFYGPLKITSAEFFINGGRKCAGCAFVLPRWDINVSRGKRVSMRITIEPFYGRITALSSGD
jgi:hypothetical protein